MQPSQNGQSLDWFVEVQETEASRMSIEFTVRMDDFKRVTRQLKVNRSEFIDSDIVDLVAAAETLEMKSVGTEDCIAAIGYETGSARLPLRILVKLVDLSKTYKKDDIKIKIENGSARIGTTRVTHPDIVVGSSGSPLAIPPDASAFDTLSIATMLSPQQLADAGMRERVHVAQKKASAAISGGLAALEAFGVTEKDLTTLVDNKISENAKRIFSALAKE
jgi:hypothetical protein